MGKRWQRWSIRAAIAIGSAAGARLLSNVRFFNLLNLKSLDTHFVLRWRLRPSNIVLITADQKTLGWPKWWPRSTLVETIDCAVGSMARSC